MLLTIPLTDGVFVSDRDIRVSVTLNPLIHGGSCRRRGRGQDGFSCGFFGSIDRAIPADLVVACTEVVTDEGVG
jgi:hypothetical protein